MNFVYELIATEEENTARFLIGSDIIFEALRVIHTCSFAGDAATKQNNLQ